MCFVKMSINDKGQIANKNIICYKRMNINKIDGKIKLESPYLYFTYNKNIIYSIKSKFQKTGAQNFRIEEGLHSYDNLIKARDMRNNDEVIIECIIPKGSYYLQNKDNQEYVSNAIKGTKIVMLDKNRYFRIKELINKLWK